MKKQTVRVNLDNPQIKKYAAFTNSRKDLSDEKKQEAIAKYARSIAKSPQAAQASA